MQRWSQAPRDRCDAFGFRAGLADHRPISRSLVKPRRTGDCMMNESWFDDPAVITGGVAFEQTKGKYKAEVYQMQHSNPRTEN